MYTNNGYIYQDLLMKEEDKYVYDLYIQVMVNQFKLKTLTLCSFS